MKKKKIIIVIILAIIIGGCTYFFLNKKNRGAKKTDHYTITVKYNDDNNTIEKYDIYENQSIENTIEMKVSKEGYLFSGWQMNGKTYDINTVLDKDITIDGIWEKENYKENLTQSSDLSSIYMTALEKQTKPVNLLVLIMNYKEDHFTDSDENIEKDWGDYIFGTGNQTDNTASINDYFKELSNGQFYFNPILLGDNKTGVYSFHIDRDYNKNYGENPYDVPDALKELINLGLDLEQFKAVNPNNLNYQDVVINKNGAPYKEQPSQWFNTSKIMIVVPPYHYEEVSLSRIDYDNNFSIYARINYNSTFGTIAHELIHTLGAMDTYNYGNWSGDLMSTAYKMIENDEYDTVHINPYYKMIFGWVTPIIVEGQGEVTLYPQNSSKYNPIIVKTDNNDQYYIIENRVGSGFDKVNMTGAEGIDIWRIDKLGVEAIYKPHREGIVQSGTLRENGESINLMHYKNTNDINNIELESKRIKITYLNKNNDGSINIRISRNK